jgi:hypothetical protein
MRRPNSAWLFEQVARARRERERDGEREPAGAREPALGRRRRGVAGDGPQPQADQQHREQPLPPQHRVGRGAKRPRTERGEQRLPVGAGPLVELQRVQHRVAGDPGRAPLGPAVGGVADRQLGHDQHLRPGGDPPVDRGQALRMSGARGRAGALARFARLAQQPAGPQSSAAQPVVDAERLAAAREHQQEHEPAVHLLAAPVRVAAAQHADVQQPRERGGQPGAPAEHEQAAARDERREVAAHERGAVPEVQQRPPAAGEEVERAAAAEEARRRAHAVADAEQRGLAVHLRDRGARQQALVGVEVEVQRRELQRAEQQAQAEADPQQRERPGVDQRHQDASHSLALERDHADDRRGPEGQRDGQQRRDPWELGVRRRCDHGASVPRVVRASARGGVVRCV